MPIKEVLQPEQFMSKYKFAFQCLQNLMLDEVAYVAARSALQNV